MGRLRRARDGIEWPLPARILIGRAATCELRIEGTFVSNEHATISWTGEHWELRDLGSKNGTWANCVRAQGPKPIRLQSGSELSFGDEGERWILCDASPPEAVAIGLTTGVAIASTHGMLALPSVAAPQATIFRDDGGAWSMETDDGGSRRVVEGEVVSVDGQPYRLHLPLDVEGTPMASGGPRLIDVSFHFSVSTNEEHVKLTVLHDQRPLLVTEREHGYLLLTLARERQGDAALPLSERGWIDRARLLKMVRLSSNALNVALHRARGELLDAGIDGGQGIVEVRRHERRFGSDRFQIEVS